MSSRFSRCRSVRICRACGSASRPAGGFCVWLDVSALGGDEAATVRLYRDGGVRVVPGSYLARPQADGSNPGAGYIRLALVQDAETTAEALHRLVEILN